MSKYRFATAVVRRVCHYHIPVALPTDATNEDAEWAIDCSGMTVTVAENSIPESDDCEVLSVENSEDDASPEAEGLTSRCFNDSEGFVLTKEIGETGAEIYHAECFRSKLHRHLLEDEDTQTSA
jgi:hypothetical protein